MKLFAIIIASIYGLGRYPGPIVVWIGIIVLVVACIMGIVNRKELDQIKKNEESKNEPPKPKGKPWKCLKCGEISEPQFATCWKCGAARKDEAPPDKSPE
ncbi:MAG TPA: hypothetical protein VNX46_18755 [Candidatus Acidoferrum sp.]|nr:hypothetical protein [Candidatus Acidoferrum sp.]